MSIGSMISNLFSGQPTAQVGTPAAATQAAPAQPGNFPAQQTPAMQSDPNNVNNPATTTPVADQSQAPVAQPEGLDKFNDLWKPVESPQDGNNSAIYNVDPKQLMAAAQKIDFTKVIQPAALQAIAQGGEGAMQAFAQTLNTVAQTVYAQNAHATAKIVEQAVNQAKDSIRNEMPSHIKRLNVSESLRADNPALSHPAAAPILGALEQQLTTKFPNASSAEITRMAHDYLTGFAGAMQKPQTQNSQASQSTGRDTDWSSYLA